MRMRVGLIQGWQTTVLGVCMQDFQAAFGRHLLYLEGDFNFERDPSKVTAVSGNLINPYPHWCSRQHQDRFSLRACRPRRRSPPP